MSLPSQQREVFERWLLASVGVNVKQDGSVFKVIILEDAIVVSRFECASDGRIATNSSGVPLQQHSVYRKAADEMDPLPDFLEQYRVSPAVLPVTGSSALGEADATPAAA